jgi:hydrogenase maturation protein HypF
VIDPAPLLSAVIVDVRAGVDPGVIGARFHAAVADLVIHIAITCDTTQTVALTGGVFQNAVLLRLAVNGLRAKGFDVITHRRVPPNDGGLALGQLLVGNAL